MIPIYSATGNLQDITKPDILLNSPPAEMCNCFITF